MKRRGKGPQGPVAPQQSGSATPQEPSAPEAPSTPAPRLPAPAAPPGSVAPEQPAGNGAPPAPDRGGQSFLKRTLRDNLRFALAVLPVIFLIFVVNLVIHGGNEEVLRIFREWRKLFRVENEAVVLAVFPGTTTSKPMAEGLGFNLNFHKQHLGHGTWLKYVSETGSDEDTERKLRRVLDSENVVMVVGHESSSRVEYLNQQLYEAADIPGGGPMPLILPAVTLPTLTTSQRSGVHILRMPATDERQVDLLLQFVRQLQAKAKAKALELRRRATAGQPAVLQDDDDLHVALVLDNTNSSYSHYIADRLVQKGDGIAIVDGVGIELGADGFAPQRFLSSQPDLLLFIGMEVQANVFLRRLALKGLPKSRNGAVATLVFTDGVAGEVFGQAAQSLMKPGEQLFLTGPFAVAVPKGQKLEGFPDYRRLAEASRALIMRLLESAGYENGIPTRQRMLDAVRRLTKETDSRSYAGVRAKFTEIGDNEVATEHLFLVKDGAVYHAIDCSCQL